MKVRDPVAINRYLLLLFLLLPPTSPWAETSHDATTEWEETKNSDGITIYTRKTQGNSIITARSVALIEAPLKEIAEVLEDNANHPRWVRFLIESRQLQALSPTERLEYNRFAAPWPASDRDFVYRIIAMPRESDNSVVFRMKSVTTPLMPENDGIIRGDLQESIYTLTPQGRGHTKVELIFRADPRGWIPVWISNLIQQTWTFTVMKGLKKEILLRKESQPTALSP